MNAQECLAVLDLAYHENDTQLTQARTFVASLIDEVERLTKERNDYKEWWLDNADEPLKVERDAALRRVADHLEAVMPDEQTKRNES